MGDRLDRVAAAIRDKYSARDPEYLDAVASALAAHRRAEDDLISREIVGRLPPRAVHESRNAWAYREAEVTPPLDPAEVSADPTTTLHWYERADDAKVQVGPVGNPDDYRGSDPIEDVALAPRVMWTEADKKAALEEAIRIYGVEPGQWFDLEWPPTAFLTDPGHVYWTEFEPCDGHLQEYESDPDFDETACDACQSAVREFVEFMAKWSWTTTLRLYEVDFDIESAEFDREIYTDNMFEVATTEQDPREVVIGPPGEGRHW